MKKVLFRFLAVGLCYLSFSFVLAVLMTVASIGFLKQHQYQAQKYSAILARAGLVPFFTLRSVVDTPILQAWDDGLSILEYLPDLIPSAKRLYTNYQEKKPLDAVSVKTFSDRSSVVIRKFDSFTQHLKQSSWLSKLVDQAPIIKTLIQESQLTDFLQFFDLVLHTTSSSLSQGKELTFLLVFQNNMELRPTGGFPGSYAILRLRHNSPVEFTIEDIYVPDGQLQDHVDPPLPIQEAFQQGFWKIRDANWHPNYPQSANNFEWFFEQSMQTTFDGMIAINFSILDPILDITGPIDVPDFQQKVTHDTVYQFLQRTDDQQFFPGSTKKRDVLNAFSKQLILKLQTLDRAQQIQLVSLLFTSLSEKNVLMTFENPDLQAYVSKKNWDGHLGLLGCNTQSCGDYLSIFEANLGVNKANCCVKRSVEVLKTIQDSRVTTTLNITYQNPIPSETYQKVSGDYKTFVRVYFPQHTKVEPPLLNGKQTTQYIRELKQQGLLHPITSESFSLDEVDQLTEVGFWVVVKQGQTTSVQLITHSALSKPKYTLFIQKQPGTLPQFNDLFVSVNGNTRFLGILKKDTQIE